jgi:WhiB family transcriptional regulator, redox-sensing transcriptional regulator
MSSGSRHRERLRQGSWTDRAACRREVTSAGDDIFFAPEVDECGGSRRDAARLAAERESRALALCGRCPVQVECLAYAVATRQQHGVWGARTEQELGQLIAAAGSFERRPPIDAGVARGPRLGARARCPAGHLYDEANTYRYGSRRVCRTCHRARVRRPARATHCPYGHPYNQANTAYDARGHRRCRACMQGLVSPQRLGLAEGDDSDVA